MSGVVASVVDLVSSPGVSSESADPPSILAGAMSIRAVRGPDEQGRFFWKLFQPGHHGYTLGWLTRAQAEECTAEMIADRELLEAIAAASLPPEAQAFLDAALPLDGPRLDRAASRWIVDEIRAAFPDLEPSTVWAAVMHRHIERTRARAGRPQ